MKTLVTCQCELLAESFQPVEHAARNIHLLKEAVLPRKDDKYRACSPKGLSGKYTNP